MVQFKVIVNFLKMIIPKKSPLTPTAGVTCHCHFLPLEGGSIKLMLTASEGVCDSECVWHEGCTALGSIRPQLHTVISLKPSHEANLCRAFVW